MIQNFHNHFDKYLARLSAIAHKIRHPSHKLVWRKDPHEDSMFRCEGDIVCDTCDILFWCRYYDDPAKNSKYKGADNGTLGPED